VAINDLFDAAMTFPVVPFTFLVLAVVVYWLLVMVGGTTPPPGDGVPLNVSGSVFIVLAWLATMTGTLVHGDDVAVRPPGPVAATVIAVLGLLLAGAGTALLTGPIRRALRAGAVADPARLVGSVCVVRTGEVGPDTGQAEVTGADGAAVVIEIRHEGFEALRPGSTAMIHHYDAEHGVFWVTAFDPKLGTAP
jgi:membrane-associated protease RseP (regulator of RpoE activity)